MYCITQTPNNTCITYLYPLVENIFKFYLKINSHRSIL